MTVLGGRAVFGMAAVALSASIACASQPHGPNTNNIMPLPWWDGIEGIKVLTPGDAGAQATVDAISSSQLNGQFNKKRFAVLFRQGHHAISVKTGYYTSLIGVGPGPDAVTVDQIQSFDGQAGGATCNFWRSIEGVTITATSSTWAVSQASPIRRSIYLGDLWLSEVGPPHWSSGGFLADVTVRGQLHTGTQQQWMFRNADFTARPVDYGNAGWNFVFVGVAGAPTMPGGQGKADEITAVDATPAVAEKPYLVEETDATTTGSVNGTRSNGRADAGSWKIYVPAERPVDSRGVTPDFGAAAAVKLDVDTEVFVARADLHNASAINAGIAGKRGLLITPGIYSMDVPITVGTADFVVLGIGFPTLVSSGGKPCVTVSASATGVRIAGLLLEAGTPKLTAGAGTGNTGNTNNTNNINNTNNTNNTATHALTAALLEWGTSMPSTASAKPPLLVTGVISDLFARVGAFSYETAFKPSCLVTEADVMVRISSPGVVLDNLWLWQADHDDCDTASDRCTNNHGLVVDGDHVIAYGLAVEHQTADLVQWNGDGGRVFFYQAELPYHAPSFGTDGHAGYTVGNATKTHSAQGVGVYIIGGGLRVHAAIRAPESANFTNMVTLTIGGSKIQFGATICMPAPKGCLRPDSCAGMGCYLHTNTGPPGPGPPPPSPSPPGPSLPGGCSVGGDAFLRGQAGSNAAVHVTSKEGCAQQCKLFKTPFQCMYWKFGTNGDWCQFFKDDGDQGWPIAGAANASSSVVWSGTVTGNGC